MSSRAILQLNSLTNELECMEQTYGHYNHRHLSSTEVFPINDIETNVGQNEKVTSSSNQKNGIKSQISSVKSERSNSRSHHRRMKRRSSRKISDLKLAMSEFYLML